MSRHNQQHKHAVALIACSVFFANTVNSAQWDTKAGMAVGTTYSDNICLSNEDTESKAFATATPTVRLAGEGSRASMDLVAALEFNTLADSSLECSRGNLNDKESPAPRLRFSGDTILLEDWFYFDADAFVAQNRVNAFGVGGGDNLDGTGNANTTYQYSLSPYILRRLTEAADLLLRYTYGEQYNSANLIGDNTRESVLLDIGSSPESTRWSLGLTGNYSKVEFDQRSSGLGGTANNELSSARVRSGYQVNSQWQINGYVGEEWNDFISVFPDTEGTFWDVGVLWTPNSRVSIGVGTGDRFFGATPRFDVTYRHKRSTLRASYSKDLTYASNLRGTDVFAADIDEFVDFTDQQSGDLVTIAGTPTTITNRPILNERFSMIYSLKGRRSRFNVVASHSEQTSSFDRDSIFTRLGVSFRQNLSQNLSLLTSVSWYDRKADDRTGGDDTIGDVISRDSDTWRVLLGFDRKLGTNTNLFLNYRYSQRNSEFVSDEYEENRISLALRYNF